MSPKLNLSEVHVWTDGSTWPHNPGRGGWAAILKQGERLRVISGFASNATNNHAETLAVLKAVEALVFPCHLSVHTDSQYVMYGLKRIITGKRLLETNTTLWQQLAQAITKGQHEIVPVKVRGHSGNKYNTLADEYAGKAARKGATTDTYLSRGQTRKAA